MQRRPDRPARRGRLAVPLLAAGWLLAIATVAAACVDVASSGATATPATSSAEPSATAPRRPFKPTPGPSPTFAAYVVRRGDTMIGLAARFETTPESLAYWNRARYPSLDPDSASYDPDRIEVGWELVYLPGTVIDPENLPPTGEATEEPGGVVGPYPTLPADGSAALVARGPEGLDAVALTFEYAGGEGGGPGGAAGVAQWLEVSGVPATVFVAPAAAAPDDPAGDAVLARLASGSLLETRLLVAVDDPAALGDALEAGDAALAAALGASTAPIFRPNGGEATAAALRSAGGAGWTWAIAWDVDPGDGVAPAAGGPIAADIVARVVSRATGGSIVRLQLGGAHTLEALPGIIDGLEAAGLRIAPLAEVLGTGAGE